MEAINTQKTSFTFNDLKEAFAFQDPKLATTRNALVGVLKKKASRMSPAEMLDVVSVLAGQVAALQMEGGEIPEEVVKRIVISAQVGVESTRRT